MDLTINKFDPKVLQQLYVPEEDSHKGQNGKLMIIGGSNLFHSASFWALEVASRIVDMVFYSSVPENNEIVLKTKFKFQDGIVVPRENIEDYINEAECILIGPGMLREGNLKKNHKDIDLSLINKVSNEGEQTYLLTNYLVNKYRHKKWVIDAGALQMIDLGVLRQIGEQAIITPHEGEFEKVFRCSATAENAFNIAKEYNLIIVLKGHKDIVSSKDRVVLVPGGNAGMTKGGTGDVLAGLIAALYCKNPPFLSAECGSYFNKKAGDELYETMGIYFNSSDLVNQVPRVMKKLLNMI